ncbi:hypothetical protein O6H91_22G068700 [Diphasiastrum complanatum]|uniref:Uncharacterized protein n=2 Tax=Diphasiastrum complanatum TaxID=34168 RepID=A0ACC2AGQ5_DIPCM|nr:hypothetical protein O6H91_22G068700 [Diphasiastrum complanatum]KAJ7516726.1 hypothetical protein O6H91_22G068700 [Diphasiastrum complanatum]
MEVSNGSKEMLDMIFGNEALVRVTRGPVSNGGGTGKGVPPTSAPAFSTVKLPSQQSTAVLQSASVSENPKQGMAPSNLQCSFGVPQSIQSGTPLGGASALSQLQKSVKATSLHVDRVMDRGRKILYGGKGSRGGGSSKKRSRSSQVASPSADDVAIDEGLPPMKIGCTGTRQCAATCEKVEKMPSRKSRAQGSRRNEKKGCQQSVSTVSDQLHSKGRSNSLARAGTTGILDLYGLKAKPVDLTRHMIDVPLDQLLSGTYKSPEVSQRDVGGNEGNLEKLITNVLNFLSKPLAGSAPLSSSGTDSVNALNLEGQSSKLLLDLESSLQPEEEVPAEIPDRKTSKEKSAKDLSMLPVNKGSELDTNRNEESNLSILDLSTKFSVDSLPDLPLEEFFSRLKLPPSAPLDVLLSDSKLEGAAELADLFGPPSSNSVHGNSIPPLPYSLPIVGPVKTHVDYDRTGKSGKVCERRWFRGGTNELDAKGYQALIGRAAQDAKKSTNHCSGTENGNCNNVDGRLGKNSTCVTSEQVVSIGSVRATLDAQGGTQNCTFAAPRLQVRPSGHSEVDCNEVHVLERPMELDADKESELFAKRGEEKSVLQTELVTTQEGSFKQKTSFDAAQLLLTSKHFCVDESGKSQVQARLSDFHFRDPKVEYYHGTQLVDESALKQASLLAARPSKFSSLQVKFSPGFSSFPNQSSSNLPVAPYSPGVQDAAQVLFGMANSVPPLSLGGKGQIEKGKRHRLFQPDSAGLTQKASKIARTESRMDRSPVSLHTKSEEKGANNAVDGSITLKKVPTFEKSKSISQVSQISTAVERLLGSSCQPGGASNHPRGSVLLLAAQSGSPITKFEEGHHFAKEICREANSGDCSVASKTLSKTSYQPGRPSKESLTLKVRTFTGGPPKQKRVMTTNFPKVSLSSGGSKGLAESSRSSQKIAPSTLDSVLGSKADSTFIVPVKSWRKNPSMEKQDTRQRQDSRFAKPSRE